jgi:hypothetical protein
VWPQAYYRRGSANLLLGKLKQAKADFASVPLLALCDAEYANAEPFFILYLLLAGKRARSSRTTRML